MDIILNLMQMADEPNKHGVALKYRESSFLDNPRTPDAIKVSEDTVTVLTDHTSLDIVMFICCI